MDQALRDKVRHIRTGKYELFVQIVLVFVVPVLLIRFGLVPIRMRNIFLISIVFVLLLVLLKERWTFKMLGFKKALVKKDVIAYTIFTVLGVIIITQIGEKIGFEELQKWWRYSHFLYLFFIVSAFQEIAYRGYLIPSLAKLTSSPLLIIVCNTLLFTLLHTIFPNLLFNLPLALIGGIGFAIMYLKYPNLTLIIISHSVLNFVAVLYGFFVIPGITY